MNEKDIKQTVREVLEQELKRVTGRFVGKEMEKAGFEHLKVISDRLTRLEEAVREISRKVDDIDSVPFAVSFKRAAELSGLSQSTLRRYVVRGHIASTKLEKRVLIDLGSLKEFLRVGTPPETPKWPRMRGNIPSSPKRGGGFNMDALTRTARKKRR